jgi:hypothetical protein
MELEPDFKEFIQLLNANSVKYLVVGGYAVSAHGFPRYTGDIDFWVKPEMENASLLEKVLSLFGFGSLQIEKSDFLEPDYVIQLGYPPNRIDIMTGISGLTFDECWEKREIRTVENVPINFISLYHLKINKKSSGRDRDKLDLDNLP